MGANKTQIWSQFGNKMLKEYVINIMGASVIQNVNYE